MTELSKRMPLAELEKTPEYQRLTPKQRLFVATYVENGMATGTYDPIVATRTAYQCKSLETARIMSYSMMSNVRIVEVLNRHFATEPLEEFLRTLDRAIRNNKLTPSQMAALKLKADILGFAARLPTADGQSSSRIPKDVAEASKAARKANRKPRTSSKPESTGYEDH